MSCNTRLLKETENVILYRDKDEELEIFFKIKPELLYIDEPICDYCGKESKIFYIAPELGSNGLCYDCMMKHRHNVKWYQEDMHIIFNNLIHWYTTKFIDICKKLELSNEELKIVNQYIESHTNHPFKIEDFHIEGYGVDN